MKSNDPQQGTANPSGLAESISTFHKFPDLPPELRIQIWKAACRPRSTTECGLHYVHVDTVEGDWEYDESEYEELEHIEPRIAHLSAFKRLSDDPIRGTTSAYLWDAGLWTACKESRLAITKHHEIGSWNMVQAQSSADWSGQSFPLRVKPHGQDNGLTAMVFPNRDILCIRNDSPMTVIVEKLSLRGSSVNIRQKIVVESWRLALEFQSGWVGDPSAWPESDPLDSLNAIYNWIEEFMMMEDPDLPRLWLIDHNVHWIALPDHEHEAIYRTCDAEYLHVSWESVDTIAAKPAISEFADRVEHMFRSEWGTWAAGVTRDALNLLVRKDNKITEGSVR